MFIDTHAHLNHPDLIQNIDDILERARASGVEKILVPATNYLTSLEVIELAQKNEMLYCAIGIHPTELHDFHEKYLYEIDTLAKSEKVVGIGEIGLDYYWKPFDKDMQQYVLKSQIQIAKTNHLPVILHNRESSIDLMEVIKEEYGKEKFTGQFHSFSGDIQMVKDCIEFSFYISFTGNLTYKPNKSSDAHEVIKEVPITNLLLETDSPYLPPVPFRGKLNEPSYLVKTVEKIAELTGISRERIGKITSENANRLFWSA